MFHYNTTKPPIILKDYGRYTQQLIQQIAQIDDPEKQTTYIAQLLPTLQNIKSKKKKIYNDIAQLWSDALIVSDYQLNIHPPHTLPTKNTIKPKQTHTQFQKKPNPFKCCGINLTNLIKTLFRNIDQNPHAKEIIILLAKVVQQIHKKTKANTTMILNHIEKIAQKPIPLPHQEIEKYINTPTKPQ